MDTPAPETMMLWQKLGLVNVAPMDAYGNPMRACLWSTNEGQSKLVFAATQKML